MTGDDRTRNLSRSELLLPPLPAEQEADEGGHDDTAAPGSRGAVNRQQRDAPQSASQ